MVLLVAWGTLGLAPAGAEDRKFTYLDLQPQSNQKRTDNLGSGREGNNLVDLPGGEQTLAEVRFKIEDGFIHLGSKLLKEQKPDKVVGIKVGKTFARLHLLHVTGYGNGSVVGEEGKAGDPLFVADGALIAQYKVHYEDGTTQLIPVVYGEDVRDWFFTDNSKGVSRGKVAWEGNNELAKSLKSQIRLYLTTWENPHPGKRVKSIDYVKLGETPAAPFWVAATMEEK
jgi:hypothetical protein